MIRDVTQDIIPQKFRVRYDRIVAFDPYDDGFGIMLDVQTTSPIACALETSGSPTTRQPTWRRSRAERSASSTLRGCPVRENADLGEGASHAGPQRLNTTRLLMQTTILEPYANLHRHS